MAMQREHEQEAIGGVGSTGLTIIVRIPTPLRKLTGDESVVTGEGATLAQCIDGLEVRYGHRNAPPAPGVGRKERGLVGARRSRCARAWELKPWQRAQRCPSASA